MILISDTITYSLPVIGQLSIPVKDTRIHWLDHKQRNSVDGNLVDGNLFLSTSLARNTSVHFISEPESAQSTIFYIPKYISKNLTQAKSILPLIYAAVSKRKLYPTKAEDSCSSKRNATYWTQMFSIC